MGIHARIGPNAGLLRQIETGCAGSALAHGRDLQNCPHSIMAATAPLPIPEPTIVGDSHAMQAMRAAATRIAGGQAKVLITGESGVGKDLVARLIHARSARAKWPYVPVNCGGITETLL